MFFEKIEFTYAHIFPAPSGEIPASLGQLTNLTSLYLSENQLSGKEALVGPPTCFSLTFVDIILFKHAIIATFLIF